MIAVNIIEKSKWPDGPWKNEWDFASWDHKRFKCLIIRNSILGHLCAYVGVPKGDLLYAESYYDNLIDRVNVHGGVTFSGERCNLEDAYWFFGFDCGHLGDLIPNTTHHREDDEYKNFDWVKQETKKFAEQLYTLNNQKESDYDQEC